MKNFTRALVMLIGTIFFQAIMSNASGSGCSDAGVATASQDTVCPGGLSVLTLTGSVGTTYQWQSFNGTVWIDVTGSGSTTTSYWAYPTGTTEFRAVVSDVGCPPDTSNNLTVFTFNIQAPTTTGDTRCGYGQVNLNAVGTGVIKWYDVPTGGTSLGTGSTFSPIVSSTTTYYASSSSNGGGSGTTPLPPEVTTFTTNARGYWFSSPLTFTITGLKVPDALTTQNIAVVRFNTPAPPPVYAATTNDFTVLFLTQGNTNIGVIPVNIQITAGDYIGILGTRGSNDENSYAVGPYVTDIDGFPVTLERMGMQFPLSTTAPTQLWQEPGGNISRVEITYEVGCESNRTAAVATVNAADPITITANPPALCEGQSSVISVTSPNANYTYTWSPATGLSSTTGASVTATPLTPITYTVIADDGTCGAIDTVFMSVGPASVAGLATISSDTICAGSSAILLLTGSVGNIQWQYNDSGTWIDETGTTGSGATSGYYIVSPNVTTQYQAVVTSGGCASVTTSTLNLTVLNIVDPTTVNDTICGPGVVNLSANGVGLLNWFTAPVGGSPVNSTGNYSPNLTTTTTYYVQASAGGNYIVGPTLTSLGLQSNITGNDWGLQFDVSQQSTIDRVYISGAVSGNVTINLRASLGGPILNSITTSVNGSAGLVPVNLGFTVNPGTGYRLEMAGGSANCYYNSWGTAYPYTIIGSPITITGSINPNFAAGTFYYFFYDWEVTAGCASSRIPVTGVVLNAPAIPVIIPFGNQLSSSATSGNQWYLNGSPILGATSQIYIPTQSGTYTVTVFDPSGCSAESLPFVYTGLNSISLSEAGISIYPNPVNNILHLDFSTIITGSKTINIINAIGQVVKSVVINDTKNSIELDIPSGVYVVEIRTTNHIYYSNIVKTE